MELFAALVILALLAMYMWKHRSQDSNETTLNALKSSPLSEIQKELDNLSKIPGKSSKEKGKYLFFDTETTGLPKRRTADPEDMDNWPYIVNIAWLLVDEEGLQVSGGHYIIKQNVDIPRKATSIHGISTQRMLLEGTSPQEVYDEFIENVNNTEYIIAHNLDFDLPIIECELLRNGYDKILFSKKTFCTMKAGRKFCTVYDSAGKIKNPRLSELFGELYFNLPHIKLDGTHNALSDTLLVYRCFMKMLEMDPQLLEEKKLIKDQEVSFTTKKNVGLPNEVPILQDMTIPMLPDSKLREFFENGSFNEGEVLITGLLTSDKQPYWDMIINLNGKVVKSITKKISFVVIGPLPGWKKIEKIQEKITQGDNITGITEIQLMLLHEMLKNK